MRTLPLRLSPVDGESLPGYVMRYAHMFGLAPGDVVRAVGLDRGAGPITSAGRYGVSLSAEQLRHAAFATGITFERLERMLLARYAGRAFERSMLVAPVAHIGAAKPHGMLIWSSRFCPLCLRDDGAWQLRWQLACNVVCLRHRVLLVRSCPKCDTVPKTGLRSRWPGDSQGTLTDPTRSWRYTEASYAAARSHPRQHRASRATRRCSPRSVESTNCSTATYARCSPVRRSTQLSICTTCARSAACCTGTS